MALYPHKSRRKRVETAATAALLWLVITGLFGFFIYGERKDGLGTPTSDFAYLVGIGVIGFIGLIAYVRGGKR